jgi:hypothetical protein
MITATLNLSSYNITAKPFPVGQGIARLMRLNSEPIQKNGTLINLLSKVSNRKSSQFPEQAHGIQSALKCRPK